jgi:hypothetical protein
VVRTVHLRRHGERSVARPATAASDAWTWLGAGLVLVFLVPFVGADLLDLQPDLYYLGYFTIAVLWFALFVRAHAAQLRPLWREHLAASLAVGQDGTGHPDGWRRAFEILWRGVVYGSVDALTLFVFPAAVAYLLMHGDRRGVRRKAAFASVALLLSLLVSTSYHLGYAEYRGADLRSPLIGTLAANVPTVLTGNPVGAVVTHSMAHVAAVVHQREGGEMHMLPPAASGPTHGDDDVAAGLAVLWLAVTAAALTLVARRHDQGRAG